MLTEKTETIAPVLVEKPATGKINYINNLKVLMTVLVILHHAFITYGAPGGWYYAQKTTHMAALFPMTIFVATNQSFFMGFFFFLSALFIGASYQKKGAAKFLADRLKRLGIPLIFYSLVLSPLLTYEVSYFGNGKHYTIIQYLAAYHSWIDFGVLWFVAALLIFNLVYVLFRSIPVLNFSIKTSFPSNNQLMAGALCLGLLSFLTRLIFPTGWTLKPLGFQLGYFPQYVALFIAGLVASKNNWLGQLNLKQGKIMGKIARFMVLLVLPLIFVIYLMAKVPGSYFNGGWNWFAFSYSFWEQLTGIMIMTALLCISKFKWNNPSAFMERLSANAFGVYIFHPVALISLSLLVQSWEVDPVVKLIVVAPSAVASTFSMVSFIRKIPLVRRII
jgi:surface polysaccharide O-acyltransferase-like enzyme